MQATINLNEYNTVYAENLLPKYCNFDGTDFDMAVVSGTGSVTQEVNSLYASTVDVGQGFGAMKITNTAYKTTDLVVQSTALLDTYINPQPCNSLISAMFYKYDEGDNIVHLEVYFNAALQETYIFDLSDYPVEQWIRLGQNIYTDTGDYTFRWIFKFDAASTPTMASVGIDGFCLQHYNKQCNNINYAYMPAKGVEINHTETIDLPSIASNASYTVVTAITGVVLGDFIQLTYPVEIITESLVVGVPIATDADEVSFVVHNHTGGAVNIGSGSYKFKIQR